MSLCKVLLMALALICTLHATYVHAGGRSGVGPPAPAANDERHNTPGFYTGYPSAAHPP
uniref:Uncharacterized protein n=1 Tax=Oryza brachyantha TaxID=4533 RepID=J3N533_ORYBR